MTQTSNKQLVIDILNGDVTKIDIIKEDEQYALVTDILANLLLVNPKVIRAKSGHIMKVEYANKDEWVQSCNNFVGFLLNTVDQDMAIISMNRALSHYKLQFICDEMPNFTKFSEPVNQKFPGLELFTKLAELKAKYSHLD